MACRISIHALLAESDGIRRLLHGSESISIHALLAESDKKLTSLNPHHPAFLSTLSLRRATDNVHSLQYDVEISIHALLAESD